MFENSTNLLIAFSVLFGFLFTNLVVLRYYFLLKKEFLVKEHSLKETISILSESLDPVLIINRSDFSLVWHSKSLVTNLGYDLANDNRLGLEKMILPESAKALQYNLSKWTMENHFPKMILDIEFLTTDGRILKTESLIFFLFEGSTIPKKIILIVKDITEIKKLVEEISERENRYKTFLNTVPFPVFVVRVRESKIIMMNFLAREKLEVPSDEFEGLYDGQFWENQKEKKIFIDKVTDEIFVPGYIVQFRKLDQTKFWVEISGSIFLYDEVPHLIIAFFDITERTIKENKLKEAYYRLEKQYEEIHLLQEKLREQAIRDPLTNLYNRRFLDQTLPSLIETARSEEYIISIVIVDVDFFKKINDTYGHLVGDAVLQRLSEFFQSKLNIGELAYRYGGEEFLLVFPRLDSTTIANKMNQWRIAISDLMLVPTDINYRGSVSMGIASFPFHGENLEKILKRADQAMYHSKQMGRNRVSIFS